MTHWHASLKKLTALANLVQVIFNVIQAVSRFYAYKHDQQNIQNLSVAKKELYISTKRTLSDSFVVSLCFCFLSLPQLEILAEVNTVRTQEFVNAPCRSPIGRSIGIYVVATQSRAADWLAAAVNQVLFFILSVLLGLSSTRDRGLRTCTYVLIFWWRMWNTTAAKMCECWCGCYRTSLEQMSS